MEKLETGIDASKPTNDIHSESDADIEYGTVGQIDEVAEKKLLRKVDLNLITLFGALYLMSFLDRSNIGNAVSKPLGLNNLQLVADGDFLIESDRLQHRPWAGEQSVWSSCQHCVCYICDI